MKTTTGVKAAKERSKPSRKKLLRTVLAEWDSESHGQRDPLAILKKSDAGRLTPLLRLKYDRMAVSPFGFFRGSAPVMAHDLSLTGNTGVISQLCGDAHVQNFGAYSGADGRLIFDINDFDESVPGPFEWDVKRMTTSILLAGADARLKRVACHAAAQIFLLSYCELLQRFSKLPILEVARFQVHRLAKVEPISEILRRAERATSLHLLERLTEPGKHGRRQIRSKPPLLRRVTGAEAKNVLASLDLYAASLLPERQHFLAQFRPLDVAFKVVGTGSVGLRDFCVYLQGNGRQDPLFLQIKQETRSVYADYLAPSASTSAHGGQRVAEAQRAMQLQSDPLLGWTRMDSCDYLVRQLNDHKAAVAIQNLNAQGLAEYAAVCGELLARGHARSGSAQTLAAYLGSGKRFRRAMLEFAGSYAEQMVADWKRLVQSKGGPGTASRSTKGSPKRSASGRS